MSNFRHNGYSNTFFHLERNYDKKVFGTYRAVRELRKIDTKNCRIHGGEVQIKFRGKWENVEEVNEVGTTWLRDETRRLSEAAGKAYCGTSATVRIDY